MLQKFAFALKSKTIEFFAEEEEEFDDNASAIDLSSALEEEVIPDQCVVIVKPDPPPLRQRSRPEEEALIPSLFAAVSSFRAAYLQLQAAHSPFDPDAIRSADISAVSHLRRLSELKQNPNPNPNPEPNLGNLSPLEAQVQENQTLLRTFETVVNRLQTEIDGKDTEAARLRKRLKELEANNSDLAKKLGRYCSVRPEGELDGFLSIGLLDSVLRDCCRSSHRFAKGVVGLMNKYGCRLDTVANSIYPDFEYEKPGHQRYAILSYICLKMFNCFDSDGFCCEGSSLLQRRDSLRLFVEHLKCDSLEMLRRSSSNQGFVKFCEMKYRELVGEGIVSSVLGNLDLEESVSGSLKSSNPPLYSLFIDMASSVWILHKLVRGYDVTAEIFQVGAGEDFSLVYMESVGGRATSVISGSGKVLRQKVGFTVVPGFRVGKTVIQCRVYLEAVK